MYSAIQPVRFMQQSQPRFGLGAAQKEKLGQLEVDYAKSIDRRKYIDDLLRSVSLSGIAKYYAQVGESGAPFGNREELIDALEEALLIRLKEAKASFETRNPIICLDEAIKNLDSGRLAGQDLPGHIQKALEEAVEARLKMKAAP